MEKSLPVVWMFEKPGEESEVSVQKFGHGTCIERLFQRSASTFLRNEKTALKK